MALSKQVEDSMRDAQSSLRNALAFAARSEKPYVAKHIANMLANIDNIIDSTKIIEMLEDDIRNNE